MYIHVCGSPRQNRMLLCACVVYLTASPSFGVHTCTCFKGRIYEASVSLTLSGGYRHYAPDLLRKTIVDFWNCHMYMYVVSHQTHQG